jgi:hypothetical protein
MENRSQNNQNRRHSGNRSGGRSRNRQGSQSDNGGSSSGGRSRSRNRNRSGSRPKAPEQTTGQKILSILTFGLLGKPKPKSRQGNAAKSTRKPDASAAPKSSRAPKTDNADKPRRNRTEVTSGRLYVGNLDYSTGEAELEALFRGVGNVLSAEVVTNPRTQQSKGFAFVEMGSVDEAKRAVNVLDDQDFMGRKLIVSGARSDGPNDGSDEESAMAGSSSQNG